MIFELQGKGQEINKQGQTQISVKESQLHLRAQTTVTFPSVEGATSNTAKFVAHSMPGEEDTEAQRTEKDRPQVHYNQSDKPTPTSISLGSPISPLDSNAGGSLSVLDSTPSPGRTQDNCSNNQATTTPPCSGPMSTAQLTLTHLTKQKPESTGNTSASNTTSTRHYSSNSPSTAQP